MSGIVGIFNKDGAPVGGGLLQKLTKSMAFRGPHAQSSWHEGNVGLGNAMLRTTFESQREQQPCSLDGRVWITADARIDDRQALKQRLASHGRREVEAANDVELILHAYHVWGEECVQHLLGDFAFIIWDQRQQRLFCGRDQFGLKLLYYACAGQTIVLSNTLNCVRRHPQVSDRLDDRAIGDFLLFGCNYDLTTTSFADIKRLPAGHVLSVTPERLSVRRYWTLPVPECIRFKRPQDYVDRFVELLQQAVADRLRTDRLTIWLSGGLDSATIAAVTRAHMLEKGQPAQFAGMTVVYEQLIPDDERYFANLVSEKLGIPTQYLVGDLYRLFERYDQPDLQRPEPSEEPLLALHADQMRVSAAGGHVVLTGDGGDELLFPSGLAQMLKGMRLWQTLFDAAQYLRTYRRMPPLGLGLRKKLRNWRKQPDPASGFPNWLNDRFAAQYQLRARWQEVNQVKVSTAYPLRPGAYHRLTMPLWESVFEYNDPGVTNTPVEFRLPFLDLRLVNYVMAMPPLPWFVEKRLLRVAMNRVLPEKVLQRPKTTLKADPVVNLLQRPEARWLDEFVPLPRLAEFVQRDNIPKVAGRKFEQGDPSIHLRPLGLNYWLQRLNRLN